MKSKSKQEPDESAVCGSAPYQGYEYQILATVWIALDLMMTGRARAVIVEPPSNEDVAADLRPSSEDIDWRIRTGEIQIQIKFRQHTIWKKSSLNELLKARIKKGSSGPAPRMRPLEYLQGNATRRYLLLTNADVDRGLAEFCIENIGEFSVATRIPMAHADNPELARRIGILPPLTMDHLATKVREILQRICHVPGESLEECLHSLEEVVRKRLLGQLENRLSKAELLTVVREHSGSFRDCVEPVHSTKHGLIEQQFSKRHAIVLVGPPGTGKTTLAEWFVAGLEGGDPPFRRVSADQGRDLPLVRKLLDDQDNHVFYFEDPWGQAPSTAESVLTSELPKLMKMARPGKVFVVTSRLNVFQAAVRGQEQLFAPFIQDLGPEDYSPTAYRELLDREITAWPAPKRERAQAFVTEALKRLQTPYSIQIFCGVLGDALDKQKRIHQTDVEQMARESNVGAFGAILKRSLVAEGPETVAAAVALWATLVAHNRKIQVSDASVVRDLLAKGGLSKPPDVLKLFNALAEGRWLQSRTDGYVVTPSVLESLGMLDRDEPAAHSDTIQALFLGWASANSFEHIVACIKESSELTSIVPDKLVDQFDQHLVAGVLSAEGYRFSYACSELARYSKGDDPVVLLARALERRSPTHARRTWLDHPAWQPTAFKSSQVRVISESNEAREFIKRFIEHRLPEQNRHSFAGGFYEAEGFIEFINQFGWNLHHTFRSTFLTSAQHWEEGTAFLGECVCMLDPTLVNTVLHECLKAMLDCHEHHDPSEDEKYRQADQGEMDAAPAEALYGEPPDSYFHTEMALHKAVQIKNRFDGYAWISEHRHAIHFLEPWAKSLTSDVPHDELASLAMCCVQHGQLGPVFDILHRKTYPQMLGWVIEQVCTRPNRLPRNWADVLERYSGESDLLALLGDEVSKHEVCHRGLLAFQLLRKRPLEADGDDDSRGIPGRPTVRAEFWPDVLDCIVDKRLQRLVERCVQPPSKRNSAPLAPMDVQTLCEFVEHWPIGPGIAALRILADCGEDISTEMPRFLSSDNVAVRKHALAICVDRSHLLSKGLQDEDHLCRVAALRKLSLSASSSERSVLLGLSNDPSCFVRQAVANEIQSHQWSDGIPYLLGMLSDQRNYADYHYSEEQTRFEVAREACRALNAFETLPDSALRTMSSFLEACEHSSRDVTVHGLLFQILANQPSSAVTSLCSHYVSKTWWESKWRDSRGQPLIPAALNTLITILLSAPELASHIDTEPLLEFAEFGDECAWFAAPAIVILCLMNEGQSDQLIELANAPSFSTNRAILIQSLSPRMWATPELSEWIPRRHPFRKLMDRISARENASSWEEFLDTNAGVNPWLQTLDQDDEFISYTSWALGRLLPVGHPGLRDNLPRQFTFSNGK